MNYFYSDSIQGDIAFLDQEESRHCIRVLRKGKGDEITLLNGNGGLYKGVLLDSNKSNCKVKIIESEFSKKDRNYQLEIAIAPTKNIGRYEWFLEKACELGIDQIYPIISFHSERKNLKIKRLKRILLSAMKQSGNLYLPKLSTVSSFRKFLEYSKGQNISKYIACMEEQNTSFSHTYKVGEDVLVLIGPEGGFRKSEIEEAQKCGFNTIHLGKSRLRTETAGIYICSILRAINENEHEI